MALSATELASKIHNGLRQTSDGEGKPLPPSSQVQEYASGLINALKAATVTFAPGSITAVGAPGSPITAGTGVGGIFTGLTPAPMLAKTQVGEPGPMSAGENAALIAYLTANGIFIIPSGGVTGICGATPVSGGPLINGAASGGKITVVEGAACAAFVASQIGFSGPDMITHYTIVMDYLKQKLEVSFPTGTVNGSFSAGGGPLIAGTAVGGAIS